MAKDKNEVQKALSEIKSILESADTTKSNDNLSEEMSKRFDQHIKEEIINKENKVEESVEKEPVNEGVNDKESKDVDKSKETDNKKESINETNEFDMTGVSLDDIEEAYNEAQEFDEFAINDSVDFNADDLEDIGADIDAMDQGVQEAETSPFDEKIKQVYNLIGEMISDTENSKEEENMKTEEYHGGNMAEAAETDELENEIHEEEHSDDEGEEELEENLINTHAAQKKVQGDHNPAPEYAQHKKNKLRYAKRNESLEKKYKSVLEENKKLNKKFVENKGKLKEMTQLVSEHNEVLGKYRKQISEMAVFNTNMANVNNLLVNESIDLDHDDKFNIIKRFSKISSIDESENAYKQIIKEYSEDNANKQKIDESKDVHEIEEKINKGIIGKSSSEKINEQVAEKTAFNNQHLDKIRSTMKYIDKSRK